MTTFRNLEAVILRQGGEIGVAELSYELGGLLVVDVGDSLEEEQRGHIALVFILIDRPA